jgi:ubiquitin-conjugating enzyme E2 Z
MASKRAHNAANTAGAIARITREVAQLQQGSDLSLAVAVQDSDVRHVRAIITGPPDTPYEYGFFEFDLRFGTSYPITSPTVTCVTTNSGRCRFNPNIYSCGKVCLSILGTWRGEPGEQWSSAQGLESILLSIQSLMSSNPYENEPGPEYENAKKEDSLPKAYIAKITHEVIRITVVQRMEQLLGIENENIPSMYKELRNRTEALLTPSNNHDEKAASPGAQDGTSTPDSESSVHEYDAEATYARLSSDTWDPFADLVKRRFLWYYDSYLKTIATAKADHHDGTKFKIMAFEYPGNQMAGTFNYSDLEKRMKRISEQLEMERACWQSQGALQVDKASQLATQLSFQFKQLEHKWNNTTYPGSRMEISLTDKKNPFVWKLTLFGATESQLDGGIFNMELSIPPDFPEFQPRVKFETPIFHHRVSSTGYLCYFPSKPEEIASHLVAIVKSVEDKEPIYDPRAAVNPGAFTLFWGGEDKRKFYNRKLRRSAQESVEF